MRTYQVNYLKEESRKLKTKKFLTLESLFLQSGRIDRSEDSENREKKFFEKSSQGHSFRPHKVNICEKIIYFLKRSELSFFPVKIDKRPYH